ncbi:MAG TPA: ATP synthase F1 subunit delta [Saprospiraceae bacterium]|nr:ATP synthase F1 subunit delta [Saprospiraceae bacterium]
MSQQKVAGRYAKSLLDLAKSYNQLEEVYQDVLSITQACKSRELVVALKSPVIPANKKAGIIHSLFGSKISDLTMKFMDLLVEKGRDKELVSICSAFVSQYKDFKKIKSATLYTAHQMSDQEVNELQSRFSHWLKPGEKMEITQKKNESLVGGFVLEMENQLYDGSVRRQMELLRSNLYDKSYINLVEKK